MRSILSLAKLPVWGCPLISDSVVSSSCSSSSISGCRSVYSKLLSVSPLSVLGVTRDAEKVCVACHIHFASGSNP